MFAAAGLQPFAQMAFVTASAGAPAAPTGPGGPDGHLANTTNVIRNQILEVKMNRIAVIILLLVALSSSSLFATENNEISEQDYLICSIVIDSLYDHSTIEQFIILDTTFPTMDHFGCCMGFFWGTDKYRHMYKADFLLEIDYFKKNKNEPAKLDRKFDINKDYQFISVDEKDAIFLNDSGRINSDCWEVFYQKYPKSSGIITFSRVGYDRDSTWAIVHVSESSGFLGGSATYIFLNKINNVWRIRQKYTHEQS